MAQTQIPMTREAIEALSMLEPEYKERLDKRGKMPRMSGPISEYRETITTIQTAMLPRLPKTMAKSEILIPMRDGHKNRALVYAPRDMRATYAPLAVLIHGGGQIVGLPEIEQGHAQDCVEIFGMICVSIAYRLAPDSPFPTAANDACDAVDWIAANYSSIHSAIDPTKGFLVSGSSSGALLTDVVIHHARDVGLTPRITGAWEIAPSLVNPRVVPAKWKPFYIAWEQNKDADFLGQEDVAYFTGLSNPDPASVLESPLLDPRGHEGLPPIALQVYGYDPFRDDGLIYGRLLQNLEKEKKAKVRVRIWAGLPHLFEAVEVRLKKTAECKRDGVETIRWLLHQAGPSSA